MSMISSNLANMESTRTAEGGPYRRKELIFTALPVRKQAFGSVLNQATNRLQTVQVTAIVEDAREPKRLYEPGHPDADPQGFVHMSNINLMQEMVNLMSVPRAYEANVTVLDAAKNMALKALEIGR